MPDTEINAQEVLETCNRKLRAILRLMLADGSCPAAYRRLVLDWISKYDRASGLADDDGITVEECEIVIRKTVPTAIPIRSSLPSFSSQRLKFRTQEVNDRIEKMLLILNQVGSATATEMQAEIKVSLPTIYNMFTKGGSAFHKTSRGVYVATRVSELWIDEPGRAPLVHEGSKIA